MRLSRKFISEYTNIDNIDFKEYADKMLKLGNEYESISKLVSATNLIIGEVVSCEKHPESDHLNLCKVDIGKEVLNIVCGAPNVREGIKVIVALDGAVLPGGTIKRSIILGRESNGMICSISELGIEHKFLREEDINGIHELPEEAIVGDDPLKFLELDDDIIDFELTANRSDELSMLGLAYESAIITGEEVKLPNLSYKETKDKIKDKLTLKVETDNAYTFLLKRVDGIKIEDSPLFIKNRLMACGVRSINNVVDISNYVMLETGQPLHFYDADKLGSVIGTRMAKNGETLVTLDNVERVLSNEDIVITNGKEAIGLAGVMGGLDTEIDENTKNVVIECAIFNPANIRKTSKKLIRSEASIRFEKGLDVNRCYMAIERACNMLEDYAEGKVLSGMLEHNTLDRKNKEIKISLDKINSVLGYRFTCDDIKEVFNKLKFDISEKNNVFTVSVPTRRVDISIPEDLIEEVSRVYGVDNIESTLPIFESKFGRYDFKNRIVRDKMIAEGVSEVITYSLISEKDIFKFTQDEFGLIKVKDPLTEERVVLRHSIISSLLDVYNYNVARNMKDISIFEISKCFSSINGEYIEEEKLACLLSGEYTEGLSPLKHDFYSLKGVIENLLDYLGFKGRYSFEEGELPEEMHPFRSAYITLGGKKIGIMGQVHPSISKEEVYVFEINLDVLFDNKTGKVRYKEISKFPGIYKDLAFVVSKDEENERIIASIKSAGGKLLKDVKLFDYYVGDNIDSDKVSLAYNLYFESNDKTLDADEVMPIFNKIIEKVEKTHHAILRDK